MIMKTFLRLKKDKKTKKNWKAGGKKIKGPRGDTHPKKRGETPFWKKGSRERGGKSKVTGPARKERHKGTRGKGGKLKNGLKAQQSTLGRTTDSVLGKESPIQKNYPESEEGGKRRRNRPGKGKLRLE